MEPFYEKKEEAKLAALEAALAAPKLPVKPSPNSNTTTFSAMEVATTNTPNDMGTFSSFFNSCLNKKDFV